MVALWSHGLIRYLRLPMGDPQLTMGLSRIVSKIRAISVEKKRIFFYPLRVLLFGFCKGVWAQQINDCQLAKKG